MTVDRLQRSLAQLYATADTLEMGISRATWSPIVRDVPAVALGSKRTTSGRSTRQILRSTVVHTVASIAVVLAVGAGIDPLLPRPDGPHLGAPEPAVIEHSAASAIPQ